MDWYRWVVTAQLTAGLLALAVIRWRQRARLLDTLLSAPPGAADSTPGSGRP